jgi:hypothetical protein
MKSKKEVVDALNMIRAVLDTDCIDVDIESVKNKLFKLTQLIGTSAEANATAKKLLHLQELVEFDRLDPRLSPSIQAKKLKASCFEQEAIYEYADRINSGVVHTIDSLRTVISLYKTELDNSLKA